MPRKKKFNWIKVFTDTKHPKFFLVNDFFAFLTIISVISVVLETVPSLSEYKTVFDTIEWVSVVFFSAEYIIRLIATRPAFKYVFSFFGMIDLLSILPSFLGAGNFTFLKAARALRIIRLLRLIRISSMKAHNREEDFNPVALNVLIYFVILVLALLATGTAVYLAEGGPHFSSIPTGMWWSFKVFMAGIPVAEPMTAFGESMFVITRFTGLLLLSLLIGVVGNVFRLLLGDSKK